MRDITAVALSIWLGVHSLRTFFAMVVWNIGEDRSPNQLGLIALGLWVIGLLAWLAARWLGGSRPAVRFGLLFSLVYIANQFVAHPTLTPYLGVATAVLWLWFFPALIISLGRRGAAPSIVPGVLLGLAAQVALQTALHGLDLPVLRGVVPGIGALLLCTALYASVRAVEADTGSAGAAAAHGGAFPGRGLATLGPYLVLQLTLLANPGRVEILTGWELPAAAGVILLGLLAGCAVLTWTPSSPVRVAVAVVAVVLVARPAWLAGNGVWLLVAAQILLSIALASALTPAPGGRPGRVYAGFAAGALLFFVLTFLYYSRYERPALWPVMAALAVLPALVRPMPSISTGSVRRALAATVAVAILGVGANLVGKREATSTTGPAPAELKIFNYNIHEIFNVWSVPDPEAIARAIEASGADLVGLQEVGRGWNVNGGPELVSWLRWRLPQYRLIYAPMLGDLVGDVILSRYPIHETGWLWYPKRKSRMHYGLMWATIPTAAGELLFVNTHFSPYSGYEEDRLAQAEVLLAFWKRRPRTVIVADFNAGPEEAAIQRMLRETLVDVSAPHGLATAFTYSSLQLYERRDYIFSSPDVESLAASIPRTTASDHLPFAARVRLR